VTAFVTQLPIDPASWSSSSRSASVLWEVDADQMGTQIRWGRNHLMLHSIAADAYCFPEFRIESPSTCEGSGFGAFPTSFGCCAGETPSSDRVSGVERGLTVIDALYMFRISSGSDHYHGSAGSRILMPYCNAAEPACHVRGPEATGPVWTWIFT